jgi:hypothetical protein
MSDELLRDQILDSLQKFSNRSELVEKTNEVLSKLDRERTIPEWAFKSISDISAEASKALESLDATLKRRSLR